MSRRKTVLFATGTIALVLLVVELAACGFFHTQRDNYTFYDPAQYAVDDGALPKLREYYDLELGWKKPFPSEFGERPREEAYAESMMATFGDSYTYGDEVDDDETWQTYLSRSTRKNVFNFGNNGYGTDQAYLRFREDYPEVRTPLVTLGLTVDNIKRVVNVYRKFFYSKTGIPATKPRFMLEGGQLRLIENPIRGVDDLERLKDSRFLAEIGKNDLWFNRDDYPELSFPYTAILFNRS